MTDTTLDGILEHYGIKGMKWGVRRADAKFARRGRNVPGAGSRSSVRFRDKLLKRAIKNHEKEDLPRIKSKPEYKGKNLKKDPVLKAKYDREVSRALDNQIRKEVARQGTNRSGTQTYKVTIGKDWWYLETVDVEHAVDANRVRLDITRDENDFITSIDFPIEFLEQTTIDLIIDEVLSHHGIKGMHWGVRKEETSGGSSSSSKPTKAEKKIAKADARWAGAVDKANQGKGGLEFHNDMVGRINRGIDDLNSSDKYRNVDLNTAHGKIKDDYNKDAQEVFMRAFEDSTRTYFGYNPSGTKRAVYNRQEDRIDIVDVASTPIQHASEKAPNISFKLIRDDRGFIVGATGTELTHEDSFEDFIAHYGIKGMRWGIRKDTTSSSHPSAGGSKTPLAPSEDHARVTEAQAKIKAGGTKTLSNKELQDVITRMNLEQQYSRLSSNPTSKSSIARGNEAVKKILGPIKTLQEIHSLLTSPLGKAVRAALK